MDRWRGTGDSHQGLRRHPGDPGGVEVTETIVQRERPAESPCERYLLVEKHSDQQCQSVGLEKPVSLVVSGDSELHQAQSMQ
jgi:hypothetical protein